MIIEWSNVLDYVISSMEVIYRRKHCAEKWPEQEENAFKARSPSAGQWRSVGGLARSSIMTLQNSFIK